MRTKYIFSSAIAILCCLNSFSQTCPNETNIANTNVCGLYGDANGNSFWNWELNDPLNPQYCTNWYARIAPTGFLTSMGSPFVNATTGKLKIIADNLDYTKAKGWELLQRKFGCLSNIANPYFILYNKYSGMARVFVYLSNANYSQILMTVKSVYEQRPATLSFASDTASLAPDKYLANQVGPSSEEKLFSLNESVGSNNWSVAEFNIMLDQNIADAVYGNGSLEIVVYGVTNSTLTARITGTSGNASLEDLKNATFKSKGGSSSGSNFNFTANGEKLIKLSKSLEDFRKGVNDNAKKVATALATNTDSLLRKIGRIAKFVEDNTNTASDLGKILESSAGFLGAAGNVLKFAGTMIGLIKGSSSTPSANPGFTNYNLNVEGELSATVVVSNFVVKIPATSTPPTNSNNATYYNGPLGIFNLKETPRLDTLTYDRRALLPTSINPSKVPKTIKYAAYRLHDDVKVVVNAGVGLTVKSIEGALVARVVIPPEQTGTKSTVSINPFEWHPYRGYYRYFNHMRADIEANRLEVTHYDSDNGNYHILQTPFYNLGCLKSASLNIHIPVLKVYLRIRATLKRSDDLGELIYFVKDYEIDKIAGNPVDIPADISTNVATLPPYANYTIPPNTAASLNLDGSVYVPPSDIVYPDIQTWGNVTLAVPYELKINHTIRTSDNFYTTVTCPNPLVTFRAGASVTLMPKFEAVYGSVFLATVDFGYNSQVCTTADITQYSFPGNYYNSDIIAQKSTSPFITSEQNNSIQSKSVYPNPAINSVFLPSEQTGNAERLKIFDMLGRTYDLPYVRVNNFFIKVDVSGLRNGVYFGNITTKDGSKTLRFEVLK